MEASTSCPGDLEATLSALSRREVEYLEARIFRAAVLPRIGAVVAIVGIIVAALHLSWQPFQATLAFAVLFVVLAVHGEVQARRHWKRALEQVAVVTDPLRRNGSLPTAP